jgi:hypothetical protein
LTGEEKIFEESFGQQKWFLLEWLKGRKKNERANGL